MASTTEGVPLQGKSVAYSPSPQLGSICPIELASSRLPCFPQSPVLVHLPTACVGLPPACPPSPFFYFSSCLNPPFRQPPIFFHTLSLCLSPCSCSLFPSLSLSQSVSCPLSVTHFLSLTVSLLLLCLSISPQVPPVFISCSCPLSLSPTCQKSDGFSWGWGHRAPAWALAPPPSAPRKRSIPRKRNPVPGGRAQGSWAGRHMGEGVGHILDVHCSRRLSFCPQHTRPLLDVGPSARMGPERPGPATREMPQV